MTREEAITNLEMIRLAYIEPVTELQGKIIDDTFDMAIKSLSQEQQSEWERDHEVLKAYADGQESMKPCKDAISRQAVLEQINCWIGSGEYRYTNATDYLNKRITSLSSVSMEKTGRWLRMSDLSEQKDDRYKCSRCGNVVHYNDKMNLYTFNRWCGRCGSDNGRHINYEVEV